MKEVITKVLTTATASLCGIGTYLGAKGFIAIGDIDAVNGAGTSLGAALVLILGAILSHLLMIGISKFTTLFRRGAGETKVETNDGQSGGAALLIFVSTAVGIMGCLPSCTPEQLAAARSLPIHGSVRTDKGAVTYDSKAGLGFDVDARSPK